jgi:hypothetical protein
VARGKLYCRFQQQGANDMTRNKHISVKEGLSRLQPLTKEQNELFLGIKNEYWRWLRKYDDSELELAFRKWLHDNAVIPFEDLFHCRGGFAEDIKDITSGAWDYRMPDELRGY